MAECKLLSIVLPTFNRCNILRQTLGLLHDQIVRNEQDVDLIVCNNASDDGTKEMLAEVAGAATWFQVVNYEEHVEIGPSIVRSIGNAKGKYFWLWSDDDTPGPSMVDNVVRALKKHPDIGCVVLNRLQGCPYGANAIYPLSGLRVREPLYPKYEQYYELSKEFLRDHYSNMGFLSVNVIRLDAWYRGMVHYSKEHFGYEFLAPLFIALKGLHCLYLTFPQCIQTFNIPGKNARYLDKWPLYIYIGMPRLLKCAAEHGQFDNWLMTYEANPLQEHGKSFVKLMVEICWANRDFYRSYVMEMKSYQRSRMRRMWMDTILWPTWLHWIAVLAFRVLYSLPARIICKIARRLHLVVG